MISQGQDPGQHVFTSVSCALAASSQASFPAHLHFTAYPMRPCVVAAMWDIYMVPQKLQISMVRDAQPTKGHAFLRPQCHQPSALPLTVWAPNARRGYRGVQGTCWASPGVMQILLSGERACTQTSAIINRLEHMLKELESSSHSSCRKQTWKARTRIFRSIILPESRFWV